MTGVRLALLLAAAALTTACSGPAQQAAPVPSPSPPASPSASAPLPRVDSALCDDLRSIVTVRQGAPALTNDVDRRAAQDAAAAAARRVLVQVGDGDVLPDDVRAGLQDLEAREPDDDARDATLSAYVSEQCG